VGCGTGRLEVALAGRARLWGVDATPEMLEVARRNAPDARFKLGRAEELPFKEGWFERAVLWLVVHLVDRPKALAELHRVLAPEGRLAIATFDPSYFDSFWLNELFPSLEAIDRARFPTAGELEADLVAAEFVDVRLTRLSQQAELDREAALDRIRERFISTLDMVAEDEYQVGLARAERELPERVEYRVEWLLAVASRVAG
jgi:ubiquinone/menaquinone biosynthesis C-methylase UbiE